MPEDLTYICPSCGQEARVGKSCPGCPKQKMRRRAKPKRSWQQGGSHDGLDLPDDDFDYDAFIAKEFGQTAHRKIGVKWCWWLLGVVILVLMALGAISGYR